MSPVPRRGKRRLVWLRDCNNRDVKAMHVARRSE
jgi:hypothetical protein